MDGKANESAAWRSGLSGLSGLGDGSLASLRFHFTVDFQEENHGKSWKIIRLPLGVPNLGSMYRGVCVCAGVLADEMGLGKTIQVFAVTVRSGVDLSEHVLEH